MPKITLPHDASKLAQQNLISTSRVDIIFTYTLGLATPGNNPGADAPASPIGGGNSLASQAVKVDLGGGLVAQELIVGGGFKSVRIEQSINVSQENALGYFEIFETVEHNVQSNQMTVSKMALRAALLSQVGLAPYGKDVLASPLLNAYIMDPKEKQRGNDVGYLRAERLHIQTNGIDFSSGQTVMENVTFRPNNIRRVKNTLPPAMLANLKRLFPETYSREAIPEEFSYFTL